MTLELDHVFCLVDPAGDWGARAAAAGYALDAGIRHPGQGTRNRRLPLGGAYVEFLWIDDAAEAAASPLALDRRAAAGNPIGVGLRGELPHHARDDFFLYEPEYAAGARLWVHRTAPTALERPFLFVMEVPEEDLPRLRARLDTSSVVEASSSGGLATGRSAAPRSGSPAAPRHRPPALAASHTVRRVDLRGPAPPYALLDGLVAQHPAAAPRVELAVDGPPVELCAALALTRG